MDNQLLELIHIYRNKKKIILSNCCVVACKISLKADMLFVQTQKQLLVSDINTMISSLNYFN